MKFADIAVDSPTGPGRTFTYEVPRHLNLQLGSLVLVPFGRRTLQGIVFKIADTSPIDQTKEILSLVDSDLVIDSVKLLLAEWISSYYVSSLFEACVLMLPPGSRTRSDAWIRLSEEKFHGYVTPEMRENSLEYDVIKYISSRGKVRLDRLVSKFGKSVRAVVSRLENRKVLESLYEMRNPKIRPRISYDLVVTGKGTTALTNNSFGKAFRQRELVQNVLTETNDKTLQSSRRKFGYSVVKAALDKGFLEVLEERVFRDPLRDKRYEKPRERQLTREQKDSLSLVLKMMDDCDENPRALLLHGVTGSGKTEVYIEAVAHCIKLGKKAIVLVPEIALTPQTIERFASRFPGKVAVMHSDLTPGERFDQWWKMKQGDYDLVVGSRSAIFAPQDNLGLVIIDEEHEWTYKNSESVPRYHARDVAMQLAGLTKAAIVLGSASPDVESYLRASRGRYRLSQLTSRFLPRGKSKGSQYEDQRHLASVKVVDMREELRKGNDSVLSDSMYFALRQTLSKGEQAILFLNRRGSSSFTQCRSCGHVFKCTSCDIAYTFHGVSGRLRCHYCGRNRRPHNVCSSCGSGLLSRYGIGTQYLEEKMADLFPEANVIRWDRDSSSRPAKHEEILAQFRSGDSQILIGTQMIAKGHHLPGVTLVGVISADIGLGVPDFRSGERSFQLLCQVAGRAGRGEKPGQVIIQTFQPDHYSIIAAARQEYEEFFSIESEYRRMNGYPPYSRLIRLVTQHTNEINAFKESSKIVFLLNSEKEKSGLSDVDIIGPTPAFPSRIKGHYRWQIILKGPNPRFLYDRLKLISPRTSSGRIDKGFSVDIDPITFN